MSAEDFLEYRNPYWKNYADESKKKILKAMEEFSNQENKELKGLVLQLQKDFVVRLIELNKEKCIDFSNWCADNFQKMHTLWHPYNCYTSKSENRNYTIQELYELYLKDKQKQSV